MYKKIILWLILIIGSAQISLAQSPRDYVLQGNYPAARAALAEVVDGTSKAALHYAFLDGLIYVREGQPEQAIKIFREILRVEPDFEPARRELTVLLARSGQLDGAVFHAERLLGTTLDERFRNEIRDFILTHRGGDSQGFSTRFAILPSTNLNRGSSDLTIALGDTIFSIDEPSRAQSGLGVAFGATAWKRWKFAEDWDATVLGSADLKTFQNSVTKTETRLGTRLDFGRTSNRARLAFGLMADGTLRDDRLFQKRLGLAVSGIYQWRPATQLYGSIEHYVQRHPDRNFLDGTLTAVSFGLQHVVSPSLTFGISTPLSRERTNRLHLDHDDLGVQMSVEKEWEGGLISLASASYTFNDYIGDFPAVGRPRNDRIGTVGVALRHRRVSFFGALPEVSYTYTKSSSNIGFFRYDSHDVSLGFTQRF